MRISDLRIAEIQAISDQDIDLSDIPEAGEAWFRNARIHDMSFGILTALSVDDVPAIMRNVARNYRRNKDRNTVDQKIWFLIADEMDGFATRLETVIKEGRDKPKRTRL